MLSLYCVFIAVSCFALVQSSDVTTATLASNSVNKDELTANKALLHHHDHRRLDDNDDKVFDEEFNTYKVYEIASTLQTPIDLAVDASQNVYVVEAGKFEITKYNSEGKFIGVVAGNGKQGYSGDGGKADQASLNSPSCVCLDRNNNIYIADTGNNAIRKVLAETGEITTIAGNGTMGYHGDNSLATSALLSGPVHLVIDHNDNLYIVDQGNHAIRKIDSQTGLISTIAGIGESGYNGDNIIASKAMLSSPSGVVVDKESNIFISDSGNHRIRKIDATSQTIVTVAGTGQKDGNLDTDVAISAGVNEPYHIDIDELNNVYFMDHTNSVLREVSPVGIIQTLIGENSYPIMSAVSIYNSTLFYIANVADGTLFRISSDLYF